MNDESSVETTIRTAHAQGAFDVAMTTALEAYARELLGFIAARVGGADHAADIFGMLVEDLWKGFPAFRFDASFRTWAYTLARHCIARVHRSPDVRRRVNVSTISPLAEHLVFEMRTNTAVFRQTAVKDRVRELRDRLDDDERELLILRVDRELSFDDIARIVGDENDDAPTRKKLAAAQRKRFERIKVKLKAWAVEDGLMESSS